jgi:hypothetical protein
MGRRLSADEALARLAREDALGQLRRRAGKMLQLGSENGRPMLDWVGAVPRMLADSGCLETVEAEARQLAARGMRHVIWAGMGGSVLAVRVLCALGFFGTGIQMHPLDSTDPRALNRVVQRLAEAKGVALPAGASPVGQDTKAQDQRAEAPADAALCRDLFADVLMMAVAMGKTSEEPISHLDWFTGLLRRGGLPVAKHALVMAVPDSYLERYAQSHDIPRLPLQLDGGAGTPGRMSAPATRVFLLPAAIALTGGAVPGTLRGVLEQAWAAYDLDGAAARPQQHPFVRLAAALAGEATDGACALWLALPPELDALRWWTEQLMEESLGKGGKGIVVFSDQRLAIPPAAARDSAPRLSGLQLHILPESAPDGVALAVTPELSAPSGERTPAANFTLYQPLLTGGTAADRLAGLAALFLGLQLCTALYAYLHDISFVGQPAVERYKARARELRTAGDPLQAALAATTPLTEGGTRLLPPHHALPLSPATTSLAEIVAAALAPPPTYLDLTINGEVADQDIAALDALLRRLGNDVLGIPVKLRRAPASYHSTEQSEMDGPPGLVSVRALAAQSDSSLLGSYDAAFLRAQAVGTWLAMNEQDRGADPLSRSEEDQRSAVPPSRSEEGRTCFLLLYDGDDDAMALALSRFLADVTHMVAASKGVRT